MAATAKEPPALGRPPTAAAALAAARALRGLHHDPDMTSMMTKFRALRRSFAGLLVMAAALPAAAGSVTIQGFLQGAGGFGANATGLFDASRVLPADAIIDSVSVMFQFADDASDPTYFTGREVSSPPRTTSYRQESVRSDASGNRYYTHRRSSFRYLTDHYQGEYERVGAWLGQGNGSVFLGMSDNGGAPAVQSRTELPRLAGGSQIVDTRRGQCTQFFIFLCLQWATDYHTYITDEFDVVTQSVTDFRNPFTLSGQTSQASVLAQLRDTRQLAFALHAFASDALLVSALLTVNFSNAPPATVPEPTGWLLALTALGAAAVGARRKPADRPHQGTTSS